MRILLLSNPASVHTVRWAASLSNSGHKVGVFGFYPAEGAAGMLDDLSEIQVYYGGVWNNFVGNSEGGFRKATYIFALPKLLTVIKTFKPDIVHAHYASSYGVLGALSRFQPFVVSVWGCDVFTFPRISIFHRMLLKFVFSRAQTILSTSNVMALQTNLYTTKSVVVTPFGIDIGLFRREASDNSCVRPEIVVGTVKSLEEKYGIEYLIKAFWLVRERNLDLPLRLLIVGGGSLHSELVSLVEKLGLGEITTFTGKVPFSDVPKYHNMLSIYVALSTCASESFGVAVLEASACGRPVVVSDIGGLPEVVENGVTGFIVSPKDINGAADAIEKLVLNSDLRESMGRSGIKWVSEVYNWERNVIQMIHIYHSVLSSLDD